MKTFIVSGGNVSTEFLKERFDKFSPDIIIAVDNGLKVLSLSDIVPDYIVGDFDTASKELLNKYSDNKNIDIRRFNPQKDATDTQIAVELSMDIGSTCVEIIGALGGRADHSLANIHMLYLLAKNKIDAVITDEHNRIRIITKKHIIKRAEQYGKYISFLPFCGNVSDLSLIGFKYPLDKAELEYGSSLGISNEIVYETAEVDFKGILIMTESRD